MNRWLFCAVLAVGSSLFASPKTDAFVVESRRLYPTPAWAGYTNTLLTAPAYATRETDFDDRPTPGGGLVRWIDVEGARNIRDLGGWNGLPTGRVFRGSELNAVTNHGLAATSKGLDTLRRNCGIRTDLDFRAVNAAGRGACIDVSALGRDVALVDCPIGNYLSMFSQRDAYRAALRVFADSSKFPIYVYCWGGADRNRRHPA